MDKQTAINLLGGTPAKAALAMGYKSVHAVYMWPDKLSQSVADQVIGACTRLGMYRTATQPHPTVTQGA